MCYPKRAAKTGMDNKTHYVALSLLFGLLIFSAGCSGIIGGDESTREILLVNQDSTDHAVVVEIFDNSELIYSDGRTIGAESDLKMAKFNRIGEYEVRVSVDGNSTTRRHTFEFDDPPIHITNIGIDNDGAVTVE